MKSQKSLLLLGALLLLLPHVAQAQDMMAQDTAARSKATESTAMGSKATPVTASRTQTLPALPQGLPKWLDSNKNNEVFYKRGVYNFAIYDIPPLARDMNGVAVGHAMAYEALVTGRVDQLETTVFNNINRVLKNPPKLMPAERFLSPTFGQKYGVLELVFDWTHVSHAQTIDNLVSTKANNASKDKETQVLWDHYKNQGAPFTITGLPMNMAWLDSQPYSGAFRRKYPKVNALFWGYHWLQTSVYDAMRDKSLSEQKKVYEQLGRRYHEVELYDTKRPFMPMMGETSPLFSARFPELANAFDNLHMLHDMVNDILASEWMSEAQKKEQIKRAIYIMSPDAHQGCKAGENRGVIDGVLHDHRFMEGMPGMGIMKNGLPSTANPTAQASPTQDAATAAHGTNNSHTMSSMDHSVMLMGRSAAGIHTETRANAHVMNSGGSTANGSTPEASGSHGSTADRSRSHGSGRNGTGSGGNRPASDTQQDETPSQAFNPTELMWMPKMGWMNMSQCHHCSMPLPGNGEDQSTAWRASTVSAEGWTMRVRCALCARDMSAETKGGAILNLSTEDPTVRITVFSDERGNLTTEAKGVVFLEERAGHPRCSQWSQAFSSKAAFDAYVAENPKFKDAKALTFAEWASVEPEGTPETYIKEEGPVKNPYAADLKARGIGTAEDEDHLSPDDPVKAEAGS